MEFLILAVSSISFLISVFFFVYFFVHLKTISKNLSKYSADLHLFAKVQKENTQKVASLLQKFFVVSQTPTPNDVDEEKKDEVIFDEQNILRLPPDVKFDVEGGDGNTPPGYVEM